MAQGYSARTDNHPREDSWPLPKEPAALAEAAAGSRAQGTHRPHAAQAQARSAHARLHRHLRHAGAARGQGNQDGQRSADKPRAELFFIAYTLDEPTGDRRAR